MVSMEGNININLSVSLKFIHYELKPYFFVSGLIFWTELGQLAKDSWRGLAAVVETSPGSADADCCFFLRKRSALKRGECPRRVLCDFYNSVTILAVVVRT
jgi:hypothetical protein